VTPREVRAFAPGRVNLIGEHTDYNGGLALPFAIAEGVTVTARAVNGHRIRAQALDLDEHDEFALTDRSAVERPPGAGWRAFVRGIASELLHAGTAIPGADLEIRGEVPQGAGLSSSAALAVSLGLALSELGGVRLRDRRWLAQLCSRVECEWVGARTGLLDQLASLFGELDTALCIDFATLAIQSVPLVLAGGWRLVTLDSGERRALAASGYNERRAECARACELLGIGSLRDIQERVATPPDLGAARGADARSLLPARAARLPPPLARRVQHVLGENARVRATVAALHAGDLVSVGALLDASHASLRDLYEGSTAAVEDAVMRLKQAGAIGARMIGGGFGGHVLGLFPPGAPAPPAARAVHPSPGAHLL
jgi:galactokinase